MSENSYPSPNQPQENGSQDFPQPNQDSAPFPHESQSSTSLGGAAGSFGSGSWTLQPEESSPSATNQDLPPVSAPFPPQNGTFPPNNSNRESINTSGFDTSGFDPYGLNYQQVQPGIIPLRPLSLGDIYNGAFAALRQAPAVMFGLVLAIWAVLGVLTALFINFFFPDLNTFLLASNDTTNAEEMFDELLSFTESTMVVGLISAVLESFVVFLTIAICVAGIAPLVLGRRPTVADVWDSLKNHIGGIFLYALLLLVFSIMVIALGLVPLSGLFLGAISDLGFSLTLLFLTFITLTGAFIVSLWIYIKLVFAIPTAVIEDISMVKALRRSWSLTKGSFWKILGIIVLTYLIIAVVNGSLSTVVGLLTSGIAFFSEDLMLIVVISSVFSTIITGLIMPFFGAVLGLLYVDTRIRREGLAVNLLRATQQG